jgi:hypothetical protein
MRIYHREGDWDIYGAPEWKVIRHLHGPGDDPKGTTVNSWKSEANPVKGRCWHCKQPVPERILEIFGILSMGDTGF